MNIVDAHAHLWLKQGAVWDGKPIRTTTRGRSFFLDEEVQMLPPFMIDGRNSAEVFLANMDYAQVSAAVIVQEYIDGIQNDYLKTVAETYPNRFLVSAMCNYFKPGFAHEAAQLLNDGFRAIKIPAHRLITSNGRVMLNSPEMMQMYHGMEQKGALLLIDLAEGDTQVAEMKEIISECPQLKIAIAHFGFVNRPLWQEQIKLARNKNVYIESGGITWLYNAEFYPYPSAVRAIREAMDLVGIEKLMWGSDYPRTICAITYRMAYDFITKSAELTDEEKGLFLGENARRFYGFDDLVVLPYIKNMSE